jgi:hypothetical protein
MVLTVSFALSPVTGLVCHRHRRSCLCRLDASVGASGPHDFAVRKSAPSSLAPPASTASRPASVTIASRPSVGRDGDGYRVDLGVRRSGIFSQRGLDRKFSDLPVRQRRQPVGQQIAGWVEPFAKPMITACGDPETRRKAIEGGAAGLLTKPIDFALLREEIDMRLERAV